MRWLTHHDQKTEGVMGLLPLARGLPVRLTDNVARSLGSVKQRRGTVVGWSCAEAEEFAEPENGHRRFACMPKYIYIKFEDEKWQIADLEPGVYPLRAVSKTWSIDPDPKKNVKARRTGFTFVPDFAGTAHMEQDSIIARQLISNT